MLDNALAAQPKKQAKLGFGQSAVSTKDEKKAIIQGSKANVSEMLPLLSKDIPEQLRSSLAKEIWYKVSSAGPNSSKCWTYAQTVVRDSGGEKATVLA